VEEEEEGGDSVFIVQIIMADCFSLSLVIVSAFTIRWMLDE
jgi:hypothetical protein